MSTPFSEQLYRALFEEDQEPQELEFPDEADRTLLRVGQQVEVRTKEGEFIAVGHISELDKDTGYARVVDNSSGTDLNVDVDPEFYDMWLTGEGADEPERKDDPRGGKNSLSVNPRKPGAYTGGRF